MRHVLAAICVIVPFAATASPHRFDAELAAPPATGRLIAAEMAWTCVGPACTAEGEMTSPPGRICSKLAREAGQLRSFAVGGAPFDDSALASCNSRAKPAG